MKLVATNGLAPSIGKKASSTVSVLEAELELLLEEADELELVELIDELEELELLDDDDEVDDEELDVVVEVDVDDDRKIAAAPATTIITTITTTIAILLIALTVKAFFRILDGDNRSELRMSLYRICYHQ